MQILRETPGRSNLNSTSMKGDMRQKENNLFLANSSDDNCNYFVPGDQEEYRAEWRLFVELRMIEIVRSINIGGEEDGK
jgi:hypothetical protein